MHHTSSTTLPNVKHIALIGNPNCGKTTIFNNLTGSNQKVGNWPGVTVEKKTGSYEYNQQQIIVTDLPGIYSLSPAPQNSSIDQQIANDFVINNKTDLYINILDATNLKRNLYLTLQLRSLGLPCLVIINMADKISKDPKKNLNINYQELSKLLACPVLAISSTKDIKANTKKLQQTINQSINQDNLASIVLNNNSDQDKLNIIINNVLTNIKNLDINNTLNNYGVVIQLLETDSIMYANSLKLSEQIINLLNTAKQEIYDAYQEDPDIIIADFRYKTINLIFDRIATNKSNQKNSNKIITNQLDNIILNKYVGIPIFFLVLYCLFEFSISFGAVFKPMFELTSKFIVENIILVLGEQLNNIISISPTLLFNLSQGAATGVATVAGFIPQIALMFLLLTFLEDSGYMARAAFVMDRLMQTAGLPGKSFVPLIIGFGCNVPAILASRTLDNPRDRILTCLMTPFMSCSARLAIFIVFASAFFPTHQSLMVFTLYLTGIMVAILTGLVLKSTILTGKIVPFILELPSYNLPTTRTMFFTSWQRCQGFVVRAGKLIIPICIILQLLNNIQTNGNWVAPNSTANTSSSILENFSKTITPILNPIGITNENWPATIGLITGSLAKEVVVGTLNTLYSDDTVSEESTNNTNDIITEFKATISQATSMSYELLLNLFSIEHYKVINKPIDDKEFSKTAFNKLNAAFPSVWAAFAYCLFVLLYIPCLSTFSVLLKETSKAWAIASLLWSFDIAYSSAAVVYQSSLLYITYSISSIFIICTIIVLHILAYKYLKSGKLNHYFLINNIKPNDNTATA